MVTVFGLGFVGLTTALGFAEWGHKVYGLDVDLTKMDMIAKGRLPFMEPGLDKALERHLNKNFIPTSDIKTAVKKSDYIYYCVGTPYGKDGQAELQYLYKAIENTLDAIDDDKFRVLVTKSTVPPSTSERKVIPFLENRRIRVGKDIGIANNPEFLREGFCWDDFINADRIVLGVMDEKSEKMLRCLYEPSGIPVFAVSLNTGEFIKYLSNTLLATMISFSNEMSIIADTIGNIDIAGAFRIQHMDRRWGECGMKQYVYPGCGYGGYCLPKDTNALYALSKLAGFEAGILKNVILTNENMPRFMADKIVRAANNCGAGKIGVLGLSFKPGSDDVRDAPSAKIIAELIKKGWRDISGYDPVANDLFKKHYSLDIAYKNSLASIIDYADILVIATGWPEFKCLPAMTEKVVVDCRYML